MKQARILIDAIIEEQQRMTASYKKLLSLEIQPSLANSQYIGLFTTYPENIQMATEPDFDPVKPAK